MYTVPFQLRHRVHRTHAGESEPKRFSHVRSLVKSLVCEIAGPKVKIETHVNPNDEITLFSQCSYSYRFIVIIDSRFRKGKMSFNIRILYYTITKYSKRNFLFPLCMPRIYKNIRWITVMRNMCAKFLNCIQIFKNTYTYGNLKYTMHIYKTRIKFANKDMKIYLWFVAFLPALFSFYQLK